jgi:hypothetical protein
MKTGIRMASGSGENNLPQSLINIRPVGRIAKIFSGLTRDHKLNFFSTGFYSPLSDLGLP